MGSETPRAPFRQVHACGSEDARERAHGGRGAHGRGSGGHFHVGGGSHAGCAASGSRTRGAIALAFGLNLAFGLVELAGGLWVGSVAVLAGAVHDLGDAASLGLAWGLERLAARAPDRRFNFGYRRFSLLSSLLTGAIVIGGATTVAIKAVDQLRSSGSGEPPGWGMVAFAFAGLAVNGFAAFRLSLGRTQNERVLTWHLLEDFFGWAVIAVGALAIRWTGLGWIDAALAAALSAFVVFNVARHLVRTAYLFLQGRPDNFDEAEFLSRALAIEGISGVDRVQAWSLDGDAFALSVCLRLTVSTLEEAERVKDAALALAREMGAHESAVAIETRPERRA